MIVTEKLEENKHHFQLIYFFKKGKNAAQMQSKIYVPIMYHKWFVKFPMKDFMLNDVR